MVHAPHSLYASEMLKSQSHLLCSVSWSTLKKAACEQKERTVVHKSERRASIHIKTFNNTDGDDTADEDSDDGDGGDNDEADGDGGEGDDDGNDSEYILWASQWAKSFPEPPGKPKSHVQLIQPSQ